MPIAGRFAVPRQKASSGSSIPSTPPLKTIHKSQPFSSGRWKKQTTAQAPQFIISNSLTVRDVKNPLRGER
jgi:hypothetical protein